jgi:hypothetical protein
LAGAPREKRKRRWFSHESNPSNRDSSRTGNRHNSLRSTANRSGHRERGSDHGARARSLARSGAGVHARGAPYSRTGSRPHAYARFRTVWGAATRSRQDQPTRPGTHSRLGTLGRAATRSGHDAEARPDSHARDSTARIEAANGSQSRLGRDSWRGRRPQALEKTHRSKEVAFDWRGSDVPSWPFTMK